MHKKTYTNAMHPEADCFFNVGLEFDTPKGKHLTLQLVSINTVKAVYFMEMTGNTIERIGYCPDSIEGIHYDEFRRDCFAYKNTGRL